MQLPVNRQPAMIVGSYSRAGEARKDPPLESRGAQSPEDTFIINGLLASRSVKE